MMINEGESEWPYQYKNMSKWVECSLFLFGHRAVGSRRMRSKNVALGSSFQNMYIRSKNGSKKDLKTPFSGQNGNFQPKNDRFLAKKNFFKLKLPILVQV